MKYYWRLILENIIYFFFKFPFTFSLRILSDRILYYGFSGHNDLLKKAYVLKTCLQFICKIMYMYVCRYINYFLSF